MKKLTALIIMDGYGIAADGEVNCIGSGLSPAVRTQKENYTFTSFQPSGLAVGPRAGPMGTSEVVKLTCVAGRIE